MDDRAPGHAVDPGEPRRTAIAPGTSSAARGATSPTSRRSASWRRRATSADPSNQVGVGDRARPPEQELVLRRAGRRQPRHARSTGETTSGVGDASSGFNRSGRASELLPDLQRRLAGLPDAARLRAAHGHPRGHQLPDLSLAPEDAVSLTDWGPNSLRARDLELHGRPAGLDRPLPRAVQLQAAAPASSAGTRCIVGDGSAASSSRQREDLVQFNSAYFRWVSAQRLRGLVGTRPNYFPANGLVPFLGDFQDWNLTATIKPVSRLSLDRDAALEHARRPRSHAGGGRRHLRQPAASARA